MDDRTSDAAARRHGRGRGPAETVPAGQLPDKLVPPYRDALPGARAEVLARLWGALTREPLDGVAGRRQAGTEIIVSLDDGREVRGPADAAAPFAKPGPGLAVTVDRVPFRDPAALLRALDLPGETARLARELDNSVTNLALADADRPEPAGGVPTLEWLAGQTEVEPLAYLEQSVVDSHPLHPCALTRTGLTAADVLAYAPEHRPVVRLPLLRVPEERWLSTGSGLPPELPVHPLQRERLRDRYPWLVPTGRVIVARPLMSLRTLAPVADPRWHYKTALDVHMTSARRVLPPAVVHDAPVLSGLLADLGARAGVVVLAEVAAGAALVDGTPSRNLAVLRRQTPTRRAGELVLPVAALTAPSPASGRALLTEIVRLGYAGDPRPFVADTARVLLPPLLRLLHAGVALDAHGENTLVALRRWRPQRVFYRDLGAVLVSPHRLTQRGMSPRPLRGDSGTDDPQALRNRLAASALSITIGELAAVLAAEYDLAPDDVWREVAAVLHGTYRELPRAAAADADALFAATLPVKAATAMRLTGAAPGEDLWAWLPNPLARWA